jgi:hypothetical protein
MKAVGQARGVMLLAKSQAVVKLDSFFALWQVSLKVRALLLVPLAQCS